MNFNRCEFYHSGARLPLLDLPGCGCETESTRAEIMPQEKQSIVTPSVTGASGAMTTQFTGNLPIRR
jgi:hypothetical protein